MALQQSTGADVAGVSVTLRSGFRAWPRSSICAARSTDRGGRWR
jgi:hypothetical protein